MGRNTRFERGKGSRARRVGRTRQVDARRRRPWPANSRDQGLRERTEEAPRRPRAPILTPRRPSAASEGPSADRPRVEAFAEDQPLGRPSAE